MKVSIICFTPGGLTLGERLYGMLSGGNEVKLYCKSRDWAQQGKEDRGIQEPEAGCYREGQGIQDENARKAGAVRKSAQVPVRYVEESVADWARKQFTTGSALVFIGACGIAVRAVAPSIRDKLTDPPVVVLDEAGTFVIPLLSGHYGGANELARHLARILGAVPVLTTATDVHGLFAVDVFARQNHLAICSRGCIKGIAGDLLAGRKVTISSVKKIRGNCPKELTELPYPPVDQVSILISPFLQDQEKAKLQLCPRAYVLGIGCRKGKTLEELEQEVEKQIKRLGILMESVGIIASVDRKQEEAGILELAKKYKIPFCTFSAEGLQTVRGRFQSSDFVKEQLGVGNVCERSAMAACKGEGTLVLGKCAGSGITVAIAEKKWSVEF